MPVETGAPARIDGLARAARSMTMFRLPNTGVRSRPSRRSG
jgi:hypothetical protein